MNSSFEPSRAMSDRNGVNFKSTYSLSMRFSLQESIGKAERDVDRLAATIDVLPTIRANAARSVLTSINSFRCQMRTIVAELARRTEEVAQAVEMRRVSVNRNVDEKLEGARRRKRDLEHAIRLARDCLDQGDDQTLADQYETLSENLKTSCHCAFFVPERPVQLDVHMESDVLAEHILSIRRLGIVQEKSSALEGSSCSCSLQSSSSSSPPSKRARRLMSSDEENAAAPQTKKPTARKSTSGTRPSAKDSDDDEDDDDDDVVFRRKPVARKSITPTTTTNSFEKRVVAPTENPGVRCFARKSTHNPLNDGGGGGGGVVSGVRELNIRHQCTGVGGTFYLSRYYKPRHPCILCHKCRQLYAPWDFIVHAHDDDGKACTSRKWRWCVRLSGDDNAVAEKRAAFELVKKRFGHKEVPAAAASCEKKSPDKRGKRRLADVDYLSYPTLVDTNEDLCRFLPRYGRTYTKESSEIPQSGELVCVVPPVDEYNGQPWIGQCLKRSEDGGINVRWLRGAYTVPWSFDTRKRFGGGGVPLESVIVWGFTLSHNGRLHRRTVEMIRRELENEGGEGEGEGEA